MSIFIKKPWTSQPQINTGVDWGNPISFGLIGAINPAAGYYNQVLSDSWEPSNSPIKYAGGVKTNGSNSYISKVPVNKAWAEAQTILMVSTPTAVGTGSLSAIVAFSCGTSRGGSSIGVSSLGYLSYSVMSNNGNAFVIGSTSVINTRVIAVGTKVSANASTIALWNNGIKLNSGNSLGGVIHGGAAWEFAIGRGPGNDINGGTTYGAGVTELALSWNRVLSDSEIINISANPWQIFSPLQKKIFIPVAAVGGGVGTGTSVATGLGTGASLFTSSATGTVVATGLAVGASLFTAEGTGIGVATGSAVAVVYGIGVSVATGEAVGSSLFTATGTAVALGTALGVGRAFVTADGLAIAVTTGSAVGSGGGNAGAGDSVFTGLAVGAAFFSGSGSGVAVATGSGVSNNTPEYASNSNLYYDIGSNLSIMLGAVALASWNASGRPVTPRDFQIGFNTTTSKIEMWNGSVWVGVILA